MKKIETKKWKDFLVKDVFIIEKKGKKYQVPTGSYIEKKKLFAGSIPRITVSGINNGIVGYYAEDIDNKDYRIYENFISVSFLGTVFIKMEKHH